MLAYFGTVYLSWQSLDSQRINFQFQRENTFWRDANFEKEDIDY